MVDTTYANVLDNAQTTIRNLLVADSTVTTYSPKVVDGTPEALTRGVGFPIVIVHTPEISEEFYSFTTKKIMITFGIEVVGKVETNVRKLTDAVRNALSANQATTIGVKVFKFLNASTSLGKDELPDGTPLYTNVITVSYQWVGVPS